MGRFVETLSERLETRRFGSVIIYPSPARSRASSNDKVVPLRGTFLLDMKLATRTALLVAESRGDFDVLHAQQAHLQSVAAIILAKILGKPTALTLHLRLSTSSRPIRRWFQAIVERLSLTLPDKVVAVSPEVARNFGDRRVIVVENGIDVEKFRPSEESRRRVRDAMGLRDEFGWVFAGRWSRHKGIDLLLDAMAHPPLSDRNYRILLLGGRAADEPDLIDRGIQDAQVRNRLQIVGFVEDPAPFLAAGDALVLPSRVEGMPLAFLEAMATGLPVLASDIPVHRMLIERSGCGWTFRSGDAGDLARAMAEIMDVGISRELRERARAAAVRYHSLDLSTSRYQELYKRLVRVK